MAYQLKCALALVFVCALSISSAKLLFERTSYPASWTKLDKADPTHPLTMLVALRQQNLDQLEEIFWAVSDPKSPSYRHFLSIDQILSIVSPPSEKVNKVLNWLQQAGVENRDIISYGDALEVKTSVAVAEALLDTEFFNFKHKDGRVIVRQFGKYSVPPMVEDHIDFVAGVSEFPIPRNPRVRAPSDQSFAIVPQTVQSVYSSPASVSYSNFSQGVIEFEEQYFSNTDLEAFAKEMALTITPVPDSNIVGENNPSAPGVESTLDIEWIAAVGRGADNWFWIEAGETWLYGYAVHMFSTQNVPWVVSISYGWSEADQCEDGIGSQECSQLGVDSAGYVQRVNTEFQKIGLRGVSLLAASGDSGANGRTDPFCSESQLLPDFPAASPYLTSVGATQLNNPSTSLPNAPPACSSFLPCASSGQEVAVTYDHAYFASGGGFSNVAPTPAYQKNFVTNYLNSGVTLPPASYYNASSRGYPDIAAFGSDIVIDQSGSLETVGGTSCSAPIVAGIMSMLNGVALQQSGKPLGFLNPLLYQMATDHPAAYTDITVGDNICTEDGCSASCKGFTCAKGWDPVTGLGSPVYPEMLKYIQSKL